MTKSYSETTLSLCQDILTANATPRGFTAGDSHFNDVWARDALYACWGADDIDVKRTLNALKDNMRDGQIPLRIGRKSMVRVFLGLPSPTGAVYTNDKSSAAAIDPNLLYVITAANRMKTSDDFSYEASIDASLQWVKEHVDQDLIHEEPYTAWDDALKKRGATAYTNVLYAAALHHADHIVDHDDYQETAQRVERALNTLWAGSYYQAWGERDVCDVAANLLAVYLNVGPTERHTVILSWLDRRQGEDYLLRTNYPRYSWRDVYLPFYLVGMQDYHNSGPYWTWITALEGLARQRLNGSIGENAARLDDWVRKNGKVPEVLGSNRKPLNRLFYSSETGFTWTAGLILAAQT